MTTSNPTRQRLLFVLLVMVFLYQADATIVNVASPAIRDDLGASGAALELVISGYLMVSASLIVIGARLGHLFGYGRVFNLGVAVFGVASLACGLSLNPVMLIGARVLQGIGGALAFPQVLTGIQVQFDDGAERTHALALYSGALAIGAVTGQLAGGLLVSADILGLSWRPIFLINVPIMLATFIAGRRLLRGGETNKSTRLDLQGAATLFVTVAALIVPLTLGREEGWPVWTWISVALSVIVFVVFLVVERRQGRRNGSPLMDLELIRRPAVFWALWPQALTTATYWGLLLTLALYLQGGLGRSALVSGLTLLPWVIAFAIPGRILTRIPDDRRRLVPVAGCLILTAGYVVLSVTAWSGVHSTIVLLAVLAVGGFGLGTTFSSMLVRLTSVTPAGRAADISGTSATTLQVLGAIGVAAFGSLYLARLGSGTGTAPAGHAFGLVTAAFAFVALISAAMAFRATHVNPDGSTTVTPVGP